MFHGLLKINNVCTPAVFPKLMVCNIIMYPCKKIEYHLDLAPLHQKQKKKVLYYTTPISYSFTVYDFSTDIHRYTAIAF